MLVDLRGNGGGSLIEALELTGLFIESGPIIQTRDYSGKIEINSDPNPDIAYGGPLAVLVNRNSASASEIFAGAIQDYRRGIIIGEPTFGKGTVQNIIDLNHFTEASDEDHGRLKATVAQFFRISGGSNQHRGVIPDIIFPTARYGEDYGERVLDNALPWDEVKPLNFIATSAPVESFAQARERHERRIKDNRLLRLLLEDMATAPRTGKQESRQPASRANARRNGNNAGLHQRNCAMNSALPWDWNRRSRIPRTWRLMPAWKTSTRCSKKQPGYYSTWSHRSARPQTGFLPLPKPQG